MAKILVNNSGPLHGEVWISGAKNSVLPLLAATILTEDTCVIEDVPDLADVSVMKKMLMKYGAYRHPRMPLGIPTNPQDNRLPCCQGLSQTLFSTHQRIPSHIALNPSAGLKVETDTVSYSSNITILSFSISIIL